MNRELTGKPHCPKCLSEDVTKGSNSVKCNQCGFEAKIFPEKIVNPNNPEDKVDEIRGRYGELTERVMKLSKEEITRLFEKFWGGEPTWDDWRDENIEVEFADKFKQDEDFANIWGWNILEDNPRYEKIIGCYNRLVEYLDKVEAKKK